MATTARAIPTGSDTLTGVGARSMPMHKNKNLPTPPNSISPNLPPHAVKPYGTRSTTAQGPLEHVESDLDLQGDGSEQDRFSENGHDVGSPGLDSAGNITPGMLAKHYLPDILLNHGPLAIRHVMGYLTTSVPGFSGIPPAKARRLVVGALEGKGSGNDGGGINGDVKFEKVGWGRWDAKMKGKPTRSGRDKQQTPPTSVSSSFPTGVPIEKSGGWAADRMRSNAPDSSWAGDSAVFSHDDDMDVAMNEADNMSLDGSCSSSEAPEEDDIMGDDPDDVTDDEDWAAVGAAALRAGSYSASGPGHNFLNPRNIYTGGTRSVSYNGLTKSVQSRTYQPTNTFSAFGMTAADFQEREAVEALLRLGSV